MPSDQQGPLADKLLAPETFPKVLEDSKQLVADEIDKKNIALRTAFNMVRRAKPDLIDRAMNALLPEFVSALESFYADAQAKPDTSFREHLVNNKDAAASALLSVSDRRVKDADNKIVESGYQKLRGRAHKEVMAAMPGVADVMSRYA